jgi:hypothetical protein
VFLVAVELGARLAHLLFEIRDSLGGALVIE